MVAAELANMKQGERTDLAPIGARSDAPIGASSVSQSDAAKKLNVSRAGKCRQLGDNSADRFNQHTKSRQVGDSTSNRFTSDAAEKTGKSERSN